MRVPRPPSAKRRFRLLAHPSASYPTAYYFSHPSWEVHGRGGPAGDLVACYPLLMPGLDSDPANPNPRSPPELPN